MSDKWVEVEAKTIDDAIKAGLKELNLEDATEANISILREPEGGVFGVGGTKALVRISVRSGFKNNSRSYKSRNKRDKRDNRDSRKREKRNFEPKKPRVEGDPKEQLKVSIDFLQGLIDSFGLDGKVEGELEEKNLVVNIKGEQTEALVGEKGMIIRSLHELTRTAVQRKTGAGTRLKARCS